VNTGQVFSEIMWL